MVTPHSSLVTISPGLQLDVLQYTLRRDGELVELPRIPMDILLVLIRRQGELVTRADIAESIWPGSDVDEVMYRINTAVNRIRRALGDDPETPRYIETVIGRGYRFIAPVDVEMVEPSFAPGNAPAEHSATSEPALSDQQDAGSSLPKPVSAAASGATLSFAAESPSAFAGPASASVAAETKPFQAARWTWLFWLAALLVTFILAWAVSALWRSRSEPAAFVFDTPARFTLNGADSPVTAQAISPDGQKLAFADASGLKIQGLHDLAPKLLAIPGPLEINFLSWFPDGKRVAVSGLSKQGLTSQVWIIATDGALPAVLFRDLTPVAAVSLVTGRIAYLSNDGTEVWDAAADGSEPRRLLTAEGGKTFNRITWMPDKPFLIVQALRRLSEKELEDNPYKTPAPADTTLLVVRAKDGAVTARENGYQLLEGCALPGDRVILRGTTAELKLFTFFTSFDGQPAAPNSLVLPDDYHLLACSVAPSTGSVALSLLQGNGVVFVGELTENNRALLHVHPLTPGKIASYTHAWSADGRSVFSEQPWQHKWYLFQQPIDDSVAQPLRPPQLEGVGARRSPDGRWILFSRKDADGVYTLFHMLADEKGGAPTQLMVPPGDLRCPRIGTACTYRVKDTKMHQAGFYALDPTSGAITLLRKLPWSEASFADWDVSPDGSTIVLCGPTNSSGVLRIFDLRTQTERLESFPADGAFRAINWNSNGRGWFGVIYTRSGSNLYYLGVDHTVTFLRHASTPTWAVPSPDGRHLAFLDLNQDKNVWITHQTSAK